MARGLKYALAALYHHNDTERTQRWVTDSPTGP